MLKEECLSLANVGSTKFLRSQFCIKQLYIIIN